MNHTTKISVIMSVYNTDIVLANRAIDSVLKQDFLEFELIIVDDGSSYELGSMLLNVSIKNENKITYLRHINQTQTQSINRAIKLCAGEFITFIDSDDEYKSNHLSLCLSEVQDADLISTQTETIVNTFEDYFVPDKFDLSRGIHVDDCILFATLFGKKEVFMNIDFIGGYAADADFYYRASKKYLTKKIEQRTYIYYRNSPNSITGKMKEKNQSTINLLFDK
jgi:glycosyltransferase involved in cell wall biosynthesis